VESVQRVIEMRHLCHQATYPIAAARSSHGAQNALLLWRLRFSCLMVVNLNGDTRLFNGRTRQGTNVQSLFYKAYSRCCEYSEDDCRLPQREPTRLRSAKWSTQTSRGRLFNQPVDSDIFEAIHEAKEDVVKS